MAIFQKEVKTPHKKDLHLEDLAFDNEKKLAQKIEEEIRKHHKHSDGSPVILSLVEPSEIESVLNDDERDFIKSQTKIEIPKYQGISEPEFGSRGLYISEAKSAHSPVFVCACGEGFSASGYGKDIEINKIEDYHYTEESGSYAHRPEPISDSYAQTVKYK